ncbi:phage tail protein [Paraflavitalea devenefica]|uniref:phage tail protein n=1 Tax=Paraflavitalea devenefica TaxID=2716334 RepID=UPI001ABAE322|nr:tail fiber protein [Paraflavitalea devenefica]
MDYILGSVTIFAGNFAPRSFALCSGQILSIAQNTALFSILGTTYGGNGQTTFALPDLRGRAVVGQGQGPGLSPYDLGQVDGTENTTLISTQLAVHNHPATLQIIPAAAATSDATGPAGNVYATSASGEPFYGSAPTAQMQAYPGNLTMQPVGNSTPFSNLHPVMALNYLICTSGVFPSRN